MPDGSLCAKCSEVSERLVKDELLELINYIAIADSRHEDSEGVQLAKKYQVERAPFFVVEDEEKNVHVFDVYFKFKRFIQKNQNVNPDVSDVA